jgi:polysaccharide biosynthesis transport protein
MLSDKGDDHSIIESDYEKDGIRRYLSLFWHWAWLIILLGAISAGSAYFFLQREMPIYETSTKVLVIAAPALQSTNYNSILTSQNLVPTYADMLTDESVLSEVIHRLGLALTTDSLAIMINVSPVINTSTIRISIDGANRAQIAQIGNTLVSVFIEKINTLQSTRFTSTKENLQNELEAIDKLLQSALIDEAAATDPAVKSQLDAKILQYRSMYATVLTNYEQVRLAEVQATSSVVQIGQAGTSYQQIKPKISTNTFIAGILGLLLAVIFVFIQDALDTTFKSANEIAHILKLPVLGIIYKHSTKEGPITQTEPRSLTSNAFRSFRTNLQYSDVDQPIRSFLVTSATPEEGKSTISVNLAVVLAQADNKVTLIDTDFHHPVIHQRLDLSNIHGLTTLLARPVIILEDILQSANVSGLSVITAGEVIPPNATEILGSKKMASVLAMLLRQGNYVVLDAPPILPVADSKILAPLVDGVILVVQQGRTTRQAAIQAVENLHQVKARIIGVVVNQVELNRSRYGYYFKSFYKGQYYPNEHGDKKIAKPSEAQRMTELAETFSNPESKVKN